MTTTDFFAAQLQNLAKKNNLRHLTTTTQLPGVTIAYNGQNLINLSSNDYLGLTDSLQLQHEFLASVANSRQFLLSASSSRLLTGTGAAHRLLEENLANRYGGESALVFNSGYHANIGILPAVATTDTLILADKLVHASIIDGIWLCRAKYLRYRHNDYQHLRQLIEKHHHQVARIIVVSESLFSMDGDKADLNALVTLKEHFPKVMLYIDEAHAVGIYGPTGLGLAQEHNCLEKIDFLVATFGKALASIGAFVITKQHIAQYLVNKMRPFIYTTALPPLNVLWNIFILDKLAQFNAKRAHLEQISALVRSHISSKYGLCRSQSHIVPLITANNQAADSLAQKLNHNGYYALPIKAPTVPADTPRIRLSLTAGLSLTAITDLISLI